MNPSNPAISIQRPSPMKALTAGFDAISSHLILILFSVVLDLLLWFGPRLRLAEVFQNILNQMRDFYAGSNQEIFEQFQGLTHELNLFSILRTFPVGIPSLMASRVSMDTPAGTALGWEIPSFGLVLALWMALTIAGLAAGTLYFTVISQAAISGKVIWKDALQQWPRAGLQVGLLSLVWLLLIAAASLPFSCLMLISLSGAGFGQIGYFAMLVFGGFLIWLFIPLVFSPHGIFVNQVNVWSSLVRGFYLTRLTLPTTSLMFLIFLLLSAGLDILWNIPANSSWLLVVGIVGHAFVTASLVAASFVYYRDADEFANNLLKAIKLSSA